VAALWLGTPVLYYMTIAPAFSHAVSLWSVSLLLWLWLRARAEDSIVAWALVGAAGGLAGLVREQDLLYLVVPGLDLVLRAWRLRSVGTSAARLTVMGALAVLVFTPQLLAYHALNGTFAPTRLVTRKMTYTCPHCFEVLLDPGHGLFVWSPLVLVAVVGLVFILARRRLGVIPILLLVGFAGQVWINGSVESWSQAGAFGSRRFVSATALLGWGLSAFLFPLVERTETRRGRLSVAVLLAVCVWWNVSLMVQFGLKLMDRQQLEWPRVAISQISEVPPRLLRSAWLFFTDRERLVRETR
jgi:hypothetical protein